MYGLIVFQVFQKAFHYPIIWFHPNLFYIERGFHSRTEIGEREIDGSTVHIMGAVGNKTLFGCLPLPSLLLT